MFERYAIYYTAQGDFASDGAAWLGWDVAAAKEVPHPTLAGCDLTAITETPRRYGFHGTLKAPFHLAEGKDAADLQAATATLAAQMRPAQAEGLQITALGRFLALTPTGDGATLNDLAAQVVRSLDAFRAPLGPDELARRRASNLSTAQEDNLLRWGYPHVMDQFRFHMTLTKRLPRADVDPIQRIAQRHFDDVLPKPFVLDALTLVGQRPDGMFVSIKRYALCSSA